MDDNPYVELTTAFNRGRLRAVLSSGQAVVIHRLAVMSKDGDWLLREDDEALEHVLAVLAERGAHYRFGAPLDRRWLAGGWSTHFEHRADRLRLRTDFVTRPPRLSADELTRVWRDAAGDKTPVVGLEPLAKLKKTNREKDYVVIGDLARRMEAPRSQVLYSRSARDLIRLAEAHRELVEELAEQRPFDDSRMGFRQRAIRDLCQHLRPDLRPRLHGLAIGRETLFVLSDEGPPLCVQGLLQGVPPVGDSKEERPPWVPPRLGATS